MVSRIFYNCEKRRVQVSIRIPPFLRNFEERRQIHQTSESSLPHTHTPDQSAPSIGSKTPPPDPHLRVVRAVEVLPRERALGPGHVAPDDEVRAPVVAADEHVLDGLAGARHVHRVRKVRPPEGGGDRKRGE